MIHGKGGSKTRKKPPLKARMQAFLNAYAELCMIKYAAPKAGVGDRMQQSHGANRIMPSPETQLDMYRRMIRI